MGHLLVDNGYQAFNNKLNGAPSLQSPASSTRSTTPSAGSEPRNARPTPDTTCPQMEAPVAIAYCAPKGAGQKNMVDTTGKCSDAAANQEPRKKADADRGRANPVVKQELAPTKSGEQFVERLGLVLTRWAEAAASANKARPKTHFDSSYAPPIGITDYLTKRIYKYFFCSEACYDIALVYMDRLGKIDPSMNVSLLNVHRLLAISLLVAAKYHDDVYFCNSYYAKVTGLSLKEINALETRFLKLLSWQVGVTPEEYQLYHNLVLQATCSRSDDLCGSTLAQEPEPEQWQNA